MSELSTADRLAWIAAIAAIAAAVEFAAAPPSPRNCRCPGAVGAARGVADPEKERST